MKRKVRIPPVTVTANACTACKRNHAKCDGGKPCVRCLHKAQPDCTYEAHQKLSKRKMLYEINDLRQRNELSTKIFDALASNRQVPAILRKLKDREELVAIARLVDLPPFLQSTLLEAKDEGSESPQDDKTHADLGCMKELLISSEKTSPCRWTEVLPEGLMIKHLLSLYCIWIHPAYPILSIPHFIEDYEAGKENNCSAFLVNTICAAACDLLTPQLWGQGLGRSTDTTVLRQRFIAEAELRKASADPSARTTSQALALMSIMNAQSQNAPYFNTSFGEGTFRDGGIQKPVDDSNALTPWDF
ncbi:MAG: hypothetical protein MMC33_009571 [Icmadophila ericetorum]|nr:hypothetical protein [Icmadophila ericetorum]